MLIPRYAMPGPTPRAAPRLTASGERDPTIVAVASAAELRTPARALALRAKVGSP